MRDTKIVVDCSGSTAAGSQPSPRGRSQGGVRPGAVDRSPPTASGGVPQVRIEPLGEEEQADLDAFRAANLAEEADRERRRQMVDTARPGAAIRQKVRDGATLTAAETQAALRWLLLRELRDED